jgi:hypothetical protein
VDAIPGRVASTLSVSAKASEPHMRSERLVAGTYVKQIMGIGAAPTAVLSVRVVSCGCGRG